MDEEERFEALLDVLAELRDASLTTPIVVEGQRDITSLRLLGVKGTILALHSGEPLFNLAEAIGAHAREVILLTDWDAKGQQLFESLRAKLAANGVRADGRFRSEIKHHIRPTLPDVESLASYVAKHLARYHQKDLTDEW